MNFLTEVQAIVKPHAEENRVEVDFGKRKGRANFITKLELEHAPLASGYRKGDRVKSMVDFNSISKGDIGTVVGPCDVRVLASVTRARESSAYYADRVLVDFGADKGKGNFHAKLELTLQGESRLWGFVMVVMGLVLLAGVLVLYLSLAQLWTSLTETTCRTTGGTAPEGSACVFPFTYSGTTYYNCTTESNIGKREPWCSTSQYFNGQWGNCNCSTWLDRTIHQIVQGMKLMALILFFPLLPRPPLLFYFFLFFFFKFQISTQVSRPIRMV
jgi:hypothetical protein